ncbi:hypothetical protein [Clostridium sp. DJ247]|uniref:hypothetical protein n=1 Tax=Clostridium sp. DJ247 TaxID=2726188 RepID=UPI0016282EDD|nr:hypothetical protein [Clostridium sp. DJ247]MBC2579567.1 hypothetical protein [Clostridium sp. DJ247]
MKKIYRDFSEFIAECASRELEYFVFDSRFTTMFNKRINELIEEIKKEGKKNIDIAIIFNTEGEIALIDSYVIGRYVANNYDTHMQGYYKEISLNNIVKHVVNSSEKAKMDFVILSYNILYDTLNSMYCDISCKKDALSEYIELYNMKHCEGDQCALEVASILILEDICKYIGVNDGTLMDSIQFVLKKRTSQNN